MQIHLAVLLSLCLRIQGVADGGGSGGGVIQDSGQTFWNCGWIFHGLMDRDPAWNDVGAIALLFKCQCWAIWDFVDVSWKGAQRRLNRERRSDCLTNKCWYYVFNSIHSSDVEGSGSPAVCWGGRERSVQRHSHCLCSCWASLSAGLS